MSTIQVNAIQSSTGTQEVTQTTIFSGTAKAWSNLNGTGTIAERDSFNISGYIDHNVADYTFAISADMGDANYASIGMVRGTQSYGAIQAATVVAAQSTAPATDGLRVTTPAVGDNNVRANIDSDYTMVALYGDLA